MNVWLHLALDKMYAPVVDWVHAPQAIGKDPVFRAYESLRPKERDAYDADVRASFLRAHGGDEVVAYRYGSRPESMGGMSLSTTEPTWRGPGGYDAYLVRASDVLVHWGQTDMPLCHKSFGHEKEIILRRDAHPKKLTPAGRAVGVRCPTGPNGPYSEVTILDPAVVRCPTGGGASAGVTPEKLGDVADIAVGRKDADFWVVRRGSAREVGRPVKEFNPEHFGVKVTRPDVVHSGYLFYVLSYLHGQGVWTNVARGTTALVNLRAADLRELPLAFSGRAGGRKVVKGCPPGLVGPFFHATTDARARKILKEGFTLDTFGERTGKGKGLWTPFGRQKATPVFGEGIYVGPTHDVAERYGTSILAVYLRPDARILDAEWTKMLGRRPMDRDPGVRPREPRWWEAFLEFVAEDANARGGKFMQPGYVDRLEARYGAPLTAASMRRHFDESAVLPWVVGSHNLPLDWNTLVDYAGRLARARGYAAVEWDGELTIVDLSAIACVERSPKPEPEPLPSNVLPFRRPGSAGGRTAAKRLDPQLWEASKKKAIAKMGGVFSARAMQLAVQLYKKAGGRYVGPKTGKEGLSKWTAEKWQTRPGTSRIATRGDTTARYLPEKAWAKLSPAERRATDQKKRRACRGVQGACFIPNTAKARRAGVLARRGRATGVSAPARIVKLKGRDVQAFFPIRGYSPSLAPHTLVGAIVTYFGEKRTDTYLPGGYSPWDRDKFYVEVFFSLGDEWEYLERFIVEVAPKDLSADPSAVVRKPEAWLAAAANMGIARAVDGHGEDTWYSPDDYAAEMVTFKRFGEGTTWS